MTSRLAGTDELRALIPQAAEALEINATYVEKDFWVMESLRATTAYCDSQGAPAIFKGGTSLSRGWGLTSRFSEDIDIVLDFPAEMGPGARDKILKGIARAVEGHFKLDELVTKESSSTKGIKRNIEVLYPVAYSAESSEIKPHVLLEVGSRGAPAPSHDRELRSLVAQYLLDSDRASQGEYAELSPFKAHLLAPERTLIEKVALLATQDEDYQAGNVEAFAGRGRHVYDIYQLMGDPAVVDSLAELGAEGIAAWADDVYQRSISSGWSCVARSAHGWTAMSSCFVAESPAALALASAYSSAAPMIYGAPPTFDEFLDRVRKFGSNL